MPVLKEMVAKFRAWDIRNSKMVDDALTLSEKGQLVTVNAEYFNSPFSFFDGCKWMQYTGRSDRNGKEIYADDIVVVSHNIYHNRLPWKHPVQVIWVNGGWMVHLNYPASSTGMCPIVLLQAHCEVVGNVYENPELLNDEYNLPDQS